MVLVLHDFLCKFLGRRLLTAGNSEWNIDSLFSDFHARLGALQAELLRTEGDRREASASEAPIDSSASASGSEPHTPNSSSSKPKKSTENGSDSASQGGLHNHLEARFVHHSSSSGGIVHTHHTTHASISEAQRRYDAALLHQDAVRNGRPSSASASSVDRRRTLPSPPNASASASAASSIGPSAELMRRSSTNRQQQPFVDRQVFFHDFLRFYIVLAFLALSEQFFADKKNSVLASCIFIAKKLA